MANKFTYKASEYINDPTFRANWLDATSQNRIKVIIDGVEIPSYSDYTYVDVKSYFKEPARSAKGVINKLNSYSTFLTPKLKFSFNSMPISAYRTLMRLIKERNEFTVQVYDPVEDEIVVRKMYFSPKDYPQLFTKGYETLRANNEEFELIGTNADLNLLSLTYDSNVSATTTAIYTTTMQGRAISGDAVTIEDNTYYYGTTQNTNTFVGDTIQAQVASLASIIDTDNYTVTYNGANLIFTAVDTISPRQPSLTVLNGASGTLSFSNFSFSSTGSTSNIQTGLTFYYGQEITIGDYDSDVTDIDPKEFTNSGFTFVNWNTARDGSGDTFLTGQSGIQFTTNKTLYAIWKSQNEFTVSFDYQGSTGETTTEKTVIQGEAYGTLPTQALRNGYYFGGWFTQMYGQGTQITEDTIFNKTYNETLYAYWIGASATVSFNANGGTGSMASINSYTGAEITIPVNLDSITRQNYQFMGWSNTEEGTTITVGDGGTYVVPAGNTTLYAVWQQAYLLTYNVNDQYNTIKQYYLAEEDAPPYVSRIEQDEDGTTIRYRLIGWYTDPTFTSSSFVTFPLEITENTNLYARWEVIND